MYSQAKVLEEMRNLDMPGLLIDLAAKSGRLPASLVPTLQARLCPDESAIFFVDRTGHVEKLTWQMFESRVRGIEGLLAQAGVRLRDIVIVALPNSVEHILVTHAAWRLGATVCPLDPSMPIESRDRVIAQLRPRTIVGPWPSSDLSQGELRNDRSVSSTPRMILPDPFSILLTGGTTRFPRLVVQRGAPWGGVRHRERLDQHGSRPGQRSLSVLPLFHGFGFGYTNIMAIGQFHSIVLFDRFTPLAVLNAIEDYRISYIPAVPTMLSRMALHSRFLDIDLSSIETVLHSGAPCPPSLKRAWIDRVGAERVYEAYGGTDIALRCVIRGDQWIRRPTSVGRPDPDRISIVDDRSSEVPAGEVGEVAVHHDRSQPEILGIEHETDNVFRRTGDHGYLDQDGYLHLLGRSSRVVVVGGVNVWAERIESYLSDHPAVTDAMVYGVPHPDLGETVVADVVIAHEWPASDQTRNHLLRWCIARLEREAVPTTFEFVTEVGRNATGKIVRRVMD